MYNNYNRRRGNHTIPLLMTAVAISAANIGFQGGLVLGRHQADTDGHVREVQAYNAQIADQLSDNYDSLDSLTLTSGDNKTYTFHTVEQGRAETCHGKYEVKQTQAHAIGNIACTVTTQVK